MFTEPASPISLGRQTSTQQTGSTKRRLKPFHRVRPGVSHTPPLPAQLEQGVAEPGHSLLSSQLIIDSPTTTRSESPPAPQPEQTRASPTQQRPRNLLRKKSASGPTRVPSSAPLPNPNDTSISRPLQSKATTHRPAAAPLRSQRSPAPQGLIGGRAAVSAPASSSGSARLTPAGAIAQAYKDQDMRREALAATVHADKLLPIIPVSNPLSRAIELPTSKQNPIQTAECASHDTELAGSPESFVMVGSAQEEFCHPDNHSQWVTGPATHFPSTGANLPIKSLTRKVSTHLRRGLAAVSGAHLGRGQGDGEDEQVDRLRDNTDRVDRRERQQSFSLHKAKRKPESLRVSTDTRRGSGSQDYLHERSYHSTQGKSTLDSPNAKSKGKEKVQEKDETSTGTKLWRLVKRISAGGLRDRFQTSSAPPVPSIPKELPPLPPHTAFDVQVPSESSVDANHSGDKGKGFMSHSVDTNVSANDVSPHSDGHLSAAAGMPSGTNDLSQDHSVSSHPRRPSISSSPQSSEPSSTHFFRSHSSRSSFSSIMANSSPPPVPVPTQSLLGRSPSPRARSRSKNGPLSGRGTSRDEPVPHARLRKRSSPDLPTFSVSDVVNNFIHRRPSLTRRQRHHAPGRSLSRIITAPAAGGVSATVPLRRAGSEVRPGTRQRGRERGHGRDDPVFAPDGTGQSRDSHGSDSTVIARPHSASTATLSAGTSAGGGSGGRLITFREMGSTRREAWTSQEKEDKWADLLNRSARAGGTLHLGAGGAQLASDNIRFSSSTLESESEMTTPMV
ncbi:hypothetical protein BC827DRAFT_593743 [Russula dissimulans]|nr:hypothetical protein BC827DRAFT_593743 [Russula dissimulans]